MQAGALRPLILANYVAIGIYGNILKHSVIKTFKVTFDYILLVPTYLTLSTALVTC
jgi:hypothetical protein